jgi:hypothetical protein
MALKLYYCPFRPTHNAETARKMVMTIYLSIMIINFIRRS